MVCQGYSPIWLGIFPTLYHENSIMVQIIIKNYLSKSKWTQTVIDNSFIKAIKTVLFDHFSPEVAWVYKTHMLILYTHGY